MLRFAICDDNRQELASMSQLITQYGEKRHLRCEYTAFPSGIELVSALEKGKR
jgi:hypothetical protein